MKLGKIITVTCLVLAACLAFTGCKPQCCAMGPQQKQALELRHYEFADAAHRQVMVDFLAETAIPALNRQGISPVGVFQWADDSSSDLYVLLPHASLKSVVTGHTQWLADADVQSENDIIDSPKGNPVYTRIQSSLLLGFDDCPKVEVPTSADTRLFQLRIYESHNPIRAKRKVEMFNNGEIATFRETGLNPVFFGESLVGSEMPNLTYMVGFDNADAQQAAWSAFGKHPKWIEMKSDPYYKDTVSNITNIVLKPAKGSQI